MRRAEDIAVLDGLARAYAKRNEEIERRLVLLLLRHMLAMCVQVDIAAVGNAGCLVRHRPELSVCIALGVIRLQIASVQSVRLLVLPVL